MSHLILWIQVVSFQTFRLIEGKGSDSELLEEPLKPTDRGGETRTSEILRFPRYEMVFYFGLRLQVT